MIHETITVQNLKCTGCANSILKGLKEINGLQNIQVNHETARIELDREESTERNTISETLAKLGYPEECDDNPLVTRIKSYSSCIIGKISQ